MYTTIEQSPRPAVLVAGYGAAGRPFADGFAAGGAAVTVVDSRAAGTPGGLTVRPDLPDDLTGFDLIVTVVPSQAVAALSRDIAARPGNAPVLDLSSSDKATMQAAAGILPDRLVDGVILGAVGLTGHETPMVFSGGPSRAVESLLAPLGCRITVFDNGQVGDAGNLKLLRSILTKGLEALAVELYTTAARVALQAQLPLALADLTAVDLPAYLAEMLRTHPRHAGRRHHELTAAREIITAQGLPSPMTDAALAVFARTAGAGEGPDTDPEAALRWLLECHERTTA